MTVVIKVQQDGATKYVRFRPSCFARDCLCDDAKDAQGFASFADPAIGQHLDGFIVPGAKWWPKSGVKVDAEPELVEIEIAVRELSSIPASQYSR
jgi:hypothetical protein